MTRQERYHYILDYFRKHEPHVTTELQFGSAFQLLVATLLSAQCTDKRINAVTPALFAKYPTPEAMAQAEPEDARHLVAMARQLVADYGGEVPSDPQELVKLQGVGRKTANVLQAVWFGKPVMAVDTHVYRVAHRLGLVPATASTPLKVEQYLEKSIPVEDIPSAHHWLLLHGRYICQSAKPKCGKCPFDTICPKLLKGSKLE